MRSRRNRQTTRTVSTTGARAASASVSAAGVVGRSSGVEVSERTTGGAGASGGATRSGRDSSLGSRTLAQMIQLPEEPLAIEDETEAEGPGSDYGDSERSGHYGVGW
ncbi:hypothetical protein BU26DRAFT_286862 [Trematosphaeria pertusa]|uniref:Uncharacterized protein n=1 Tax=Trematosphaeria pertusa TaxID=390896 RepID=A0A6A6IHH0_9PLEO|nr:uncharacterized protein BU26DRAFT_286862 [Trematosphaeria pertusa]KAF2249617.1 hypothetical protein BU26DRAFT_286862 [Trematosphaeria pertusa]